MNKIYQSGMDITPAVAQRSAHRLLGRGFDSLELITDVTRSLNFEHL
jgi:hypothetical protein